MTEKALSGLRVLEHASFISGPYCTKLMADLGAEVMKVEEPAIGDEARRYGPFPRHIPHPERSGLFLYLNTDKMSITLNLKVRTGRDIFKRLLKDVDMLVESNPPQEMERLGLHYAQLREINPRLIMTSITPFGQSGPYRDYEGYTLNCSALGGMSIAIGEPGREPLTPPLHLGHFQSGAAGAVGSLFALFARELTGRGQQVDLSEADVWASLHMGNAMSAYVLHELKRMRAGHRTPGVYPYTILPCRDGFMSMIALQGYQWKRFLELVGGGDVPQWYSKDSRFSDRREMSLKYADELDELLAPWLMSHTRQEIYELCRQRRIPFCPVKNIDEVANDAHLDEREYFVEIGRAETGVLKYPGAPFKLSETPWRLDRPAPLLGEHNEEVYCNRLGYSHEELAGLGRAGII